MLFWKLISYIIDLNLVGGLPIRKNVIFVRITKQKFMFYWYYFKIIYKNIDKIIQNYQFRENYTLNVKVFMNPLLRGGILVYKAKSN